jgi:hypothetical protein
MDLSLHTLPIPDGLSETSRREAKRTRKRLRDRAEKVQTDHGLVFKWKESGNVVPPDCLERALVAQPPGQEAARTEEREEAFKRYRQQQADRSQAEKEAQRQDARAAHGEGTDMVNVVTGERWTT